MYLIDNTVSTDVTTQRRSWRIQLGRKIAWLLAIKFVALLILWTLFFSPGQRVDVSPAGSAQHLAVDPQSAAP